MRSLYWGHSYSEPQENAASMAKSILKKPFVSSASKVGLEKMGESRG